jgi:hypothetical protein
VVNGEICKTYGSGNGKSVAQAACEITQVRINWLLQLAACHCALSQPHGQLLASTALYLCSADTKSVTAAVHPHDIIIAQLSSQSFNCWASILAQQQCRVPAACSNCAALQEESSLQGGNGLPTGQLPRHVHRTAERMDGWMSTLCACAVQSLQTYCSGKPPLAKSYFPVTLSQCANVAFGTCQNRAMDRNSSPCGWQFNGYQQCNFAKFMGFYTGMPWLSHGQLETSLVSSCPCVAMCNTSLHHGNAGLYYNK